MTRKRFALTMLTWLGLVLSVLILTMVTLTFVQAQGSAASITILKEADQMVVRGSSASFSIDVRNSGDVTLTNVTVSDTLAPSCNRVFAELLSGEHRSYTCAVTGVTEDFVNTATVTGTTPEGGEVTHSDTASVDVIDPDIQIAKTPDQQMVVRGSSASFNIDVSNTGDVALTNVTVSDAEAPNCNRTFAELLSGAHQSYSCAVAGVTEDFVNTATVTGTAPVGGEVTHSDTASVDVVDLGIQIAKTPDQQVVVRGSSASFNIDVRNSGDVTLTNVTVSDVQAPNCNRAFAQLLSGAHRSYACAVANVTDGFINSATVTGTAQHTGQNVTDADAAKVRLDDTGTCPASMIAYWKLDEPNGVTTYDDFYYGHDGECADDCPTLATGQVNGGQAFDGYNDGIDVPLVPGDDSFDWGAQDSFSIEYWLQPDSDGCSGNQVVVGRDDSSTNLHWWTGCWTGGQAAFVLGDTDGGGDIQILVGDTKLNDGFWHHVVAVRDASAGENRLYVDGTVEAATPATYTAGFGSPTVGLNIGWLDLLGGYRFDGILDEVAMYDRALSAGEVRQHHNEGLAGRWYCQGGTFAPIIVSTPVTDATVGRPYMYDVEAAGNPVPTYALVINPNGMTIDPATGLISWTPTVAQEGSHDVEVRASNSEGADTQSFAIVVQKGTLCPADMIAYWKLEEPDGATTYDDFYNGHEGECAGACPKQAIGKIGAGQEFDSTTGIDVPVGPGGDPFDWGAQDSFSIEYWLQPDSGSTGSGNQVVVGRDDSSTSLHWWTGRWTDGEAAFVLGDADGGGDIQILVGDTKLNDGFWHHVVAVRDASAGENRLYVDGTVEAATPATYTAGFGSPTVGLNIGWLDLLGGFHFDGILDEVAVYDRALSTDEIEQHYDNGDAGPGYCISPDIGVKKAVDAMVVYPGSLATYIYTVTNPGDVPLSAIRWHDDKCSPVTFVGGDGDGDNLLDPIETWVYTCSMTLNTDITNTVIVTGSPSLGDKITSVDVVFVDVISPAIGIDKVADPALVYAGDTVVYTYTVTNPGDDPLSYVHVSDDQCSPVTEAGGDDNGNYALDPDETWTYACSTVPDAATTNTATATGTDSAGGPVSAMDVDPTLTVFKRADDDIVFEFTITSANTDKALYLRNGGWAQLADLAPDSYTITETVVSQWKLVSITCTNGISLDAPDTPAVTVGLQSAQDVSCTFTNRKANRIFLPTVLRD